MKSLIAIVTLLALCWLATDVRSDNTLFNALAPLGMVIFGLALALWVTFALAAKKSRDRPAPEMPDEALQRDRTGQSLSDN